MGRHTRLRTLKEAAVTSCRLDPSKMHCSCCSLLRLYSPLCPLIARLFLSRIVSFEGNVEYTTSDVNQNLMLREKFEAREIFMLGEGSDVQFSTISA